MIKVISILCLTFLFSCERPNSQIDDIVPSCGSNSAIFEIDNESFCTTIHECGGASWKKYSICGNDGKSNKLLIWVFFEDLEIQGAELRKFTGLRCEVHNFRGNGVYPIFLDKSSNEGSHLKDKDYENIIENGTLAVNEMAEGKLSGNISLKLNINKTIKKAKVRLFEIKVD
ncbi:hypothetical protein [Jiulongibacter sp. NS-SX5]|uniref:hypothetical protein n=1 Tax=Jiulongibacter sp. NS-SX5 TaxID=3463854 RepID=UPI00405A40C4